MRDNTVTMTAQVVILDPALLRHITPMADLYDGDLKAPAYLLSGCTEPDGIFSLSKLHVSVLAKDLAPILFPNV